MTDKLQSPTPPDAPATPTLKRHRHAAKHAPVAQQPGAPDDNQDAIARAYLEKIKRETEEKEKANLEKYQAGVGKLSQECGIAVGTQVVSVYGPDGKILSTIATPVYFKLTAQEQKP